MKYYISSENAWGITVIIDISAKLNISLEKKGAIYSDTEIIFVVVAAAVVSCINLDVAVENNFYRDKPIIKKVYGEKSNKNLT